MLCAMPRLIALLLLFAALPAWAEDPAELAVGDAIDAFSLEDQHGVLHAVDQNVRAIVFAREMEGGEVVKEALADVGAVLLAEAGAVYVANVSGMPAIIRRMFALPRMRKRGYPVLLDTEGAVSERFPGRDGRATLIRLDALTIVGVDQFFAMEELQTALRSLAPEAAAGD